MRDSVHDLMEACVAELKASIPVSVPHLEELNLLSEKIGIHRQSKPANHEQTIAAQTELLSLASLPDPIIEQTRDMLRRDREEVNEQRKVLDEERRNFTDAAIKMGLERAGLQREREMLDGREKVAAVPTTPIWLRSRLQKVARFSTF